MTVPTLLHPFEDTPGSRWKFITLFSFLNWPSSDGRSSLQVLLGSFQNVPWQYFKARRGVYCTKFVFEEHLCKRVHLNIPHFKLETWQTITLLSSFYFRFSCSSHYLMIISTSQPALQSVFLQYVFLLGKPIQHHKTRHITILASSPCVDGCTGM